MEDAHLARFNLTGKEGDDLHLFGVFDGHGGKEVAKFCEKHFVEEFLASEGIKKKDYDKALKDTFLRMDELLKDPKNKAEIRALAGNADN